MSENYLGSASLMDVAKYAYTIMLFIRKLYRRPATFLFNQREYTYFEHPYNGTWMNERALEIPVVWEEVRSHAPDMLLEVGNVLSHYFDVKHTVIDKYEHRPGVISKDIMDIKLDRKFNCIVSISTLEHIGWDENPRVPGKHLQAIARMRQLLSSNGKLLATIPLGYNPTFDRDIFDGRLECSHVFYFKRLSKDAWRETTEAHVRDSSYGKEYRTTNGLAVCEWLS